MSYYQCKYDDCDKIFLHKDSYVKHFKKKHGDNVTYNTLSDHHRKIYVNSFYIKTYKCPETIRINIKKLISTKSSLTDEEFKNEVNNAIENNLILQQPNEHINDDEVQCCSPCTVSAFPISPNCGPISITEKSKDDNTVPIIATKASSSAFIAETKALSSALSTTTNISSNRNLLINYVMPANNSTLSFGEFNYKNKNSDKITDKIPNNFPEKKQVFSDLFNFETDEKLEEKELESPKKNNKRKSFVINLSDVQLKNSRVIYNLEDISMKEMNHMLNSTKKFKNIELSDNNFINNKSNYFVKNVEKFYKNDLDTIFNLEEYLNYLLYNF